MDATTPKYDQKRYNEIVENCAEFLKKTGYKIKKKV